MGIENWVEQFQASQKERERFINQGRVAQRVYKGRTFEAGRDPYEYNLFWANVGVLRSALYANPPKPMVTREFMDYQDQAGRVASLIMERMLTYEQDTPLDPTHTSIVCAVNDKLVPGLGQVWLRYEPTIERVEVSGMVGAGGEATAEGTVAEVLRDEQVVVDYVYWEDFLWSPARTWDEVWWVARRVYMSKQELTERFGEEAAEKASYTDKRGKATAGELTPRNLRDRKAKVYEVWNKKNKTVCFYLEDSNDPLEDNSDPLGIPDFFPCPKPLASNIMNGNFMPISDYQMVKDVYIRIDIISRRIFMLEEAIRVVGVYDKANNELKELLQRSGFNKMVPVDNWAYMAEKGGLKGSVDWFPLDQVISTVIQLRQEFQAAKQDLYELTGISDIMRGTTHPRETAAAQQMKAQYSSTRLQYQQNEVAVFVQQILRIKASIITNHFQPKTIARRSNIWLTPDKELAPQAIQILKDQWEAAYRVKIDVDQLAIPDYNAERQGRVEFITAMGQFVSQAFPLIQAEPGAGPFMLEILKWGISSFHSAQSIEGVFDRAANALTRSLQQKTQGQQGPSPEQIKEMRETRESQADIARKDRETQADIIRENRETDADIARDDRKAAADIRTARLRARSGS